MNARKRLTAIAVGLLIMAGGAFATAAPASASVSGDIQCFYGNDAVVGAWVEVPGGTSGWASLSPDGYGGANYSYGAVSAGTTYRLHVGCGGTPQSWGTTFYTPYVTGGYYDWICTSGYGC